jgi:hypothetical protein
MSGIIKLPPGLAPVFASLVRGAGETVEVRPATGAPATVRASVQSPASAVLTNDAIQEGLLVYISPLDLAAIPQQFDKIIVRGQERTVQESHSIEADGKPLMWQMLVLG